MLWTVDTVWKTAVQCGVGFPTWAWLSPAVWPGVLTTPLTGLSKDRNWPRPKLMANHVKLCIVETYVDPNILCITMGEIRMDSNRCVVSHWDAVWNKHSCLNLWICEKTLVSPDIMGMCCEPCGDLASLTRCVKSCGAYALQTSSRPIVWSPLETCVEVWCVGGPQCHPVMSWWPGLGWWLHTRHSREDSGSGSRLTGYPTATHHIQGQYCSVLTVCTQLLQFAYIISTAWIFCWAAATVPLVINIELLPSTKCCTVLSAGLTTAGNQGSSQCFTEQYEPWPRLLYCHVVLSQRNFVRR